VTYLPARFGQVYGLYEVHSTQLSPFLTPQARSQTPALVIVHTQKIWTEYAGLLELEDPWLTSPLFLPGAITARSVMLPWQPSIRTGKSFITMRMNRINSTPHPGNPMQWRLQLLLSPTSIPSFLRHGPINRKMKIAIPRTAAGTE